MAKLPERIGKYSVVGLIGRGGMGSVYKAHDPHLDRMVAIKVMTEEADLDSEARARFMREARSAARLNHPNIITVYELGEETSRTFIVMEFLEGEPLSRVIGRVPSAPLAEKLAIMVQICDGLAFAHQRGVVHRDVKPANIFVLQSGQVKILDFGIARLASSELTRTGFLMGTPNYMSPEQARGRRADARSDIFSAGVVFYELLSGKKPFAGSDYIEVLEKLRSEEPRWLAELQPSLPPPLVDAVHRALAKDIAERFQALDGLRRALVEVLDSLGGEGGVELREAVARKLAEVVRLHRMLVATVGAAALGDEKLPVLDQSAAGVGLRTLLRELEGQADRLHAFARRVEQLEPAVGRGIAAAERGEFAEAARELDAVLAEVPQHQRAREYRERARIEQELERTVRAFGVPPPDSLRQPTVVSDKPPPPPASPPVKTSAATRSMPTAAPRAALPRAVGTGAVVDETHAGSGRRSHYILVTVAALAVVGGGVLLFGPLSPRPGGFGPRPPAVEAPRPPQPPPGSGVAPRPGSTPTPAPVATSPPTPRPGAPAPAPPAASKPAEPKPVTKAPAAEAKPPVKPSPMEPKPVARTPASEAKPSPPEPKPVARTPAPEAKPSPPAPPVASRPVPKAPSPPPPAPRPLTEEQQRTVEDTLTLAQLFQARGDHERARREYRKILDLDPTHAEAKQGVVAAEQALRGSQ